MFTHFSATDKMLKTKHWFINNLQQVSGRTWTVRRTTAPPPLRSQQADVNVTPAKNHRRSKWPINQSCSSSCFLPLLSANKDKFCRSTQIVLRGELGTNRINTCGLIGWNHAAMTSVAKTGRRRESDSSLLPAAFLIAVKLKGSGLLASLGVQSLSVSTAAGSVCVSDFFCA